MKKVILILSLFYVAIEVDSCSPCPGPPAPCHTRKFKSPAADMMPSKCPHCDYCQGDCVTFCKGRSECDFIETLKLSDFMRDVLDFGKCNKSKKEGKADRFEAIFGSSGIKYPSVISKIPNLKCLGTCEKLKKLCCKHC